MPFDEEYLEGHEECAMEIRRLRAEIERFPAISKVRVIAGHTDERQLVKVELPFSWVTLKIPCTLGELFEAAVAAGGDDDV